MNKPEFRRRGFDTESQREEDDEGRNEDGNEGYGGGPQHPDVTLTAELVQYQDAGPEADLLAIPPRADDLGTALAARPPRGKLPKLTVALASAALICAGFIGGVLVQKHLGGSSSGNRGAFASGFTTGRTGGTGGTGFFGRGGTSRTGGTGAAGGSSFTGTVTVVSGNTVYVTAPDGSVYTVTTNGSTVISVTQQGTISQLKPGQSVVIAGSDDSKGDVTATSITANDGASSNSSTSGKNTGGQ